jgi:hypothetical protein
MEVVQTRLVAHVPGGIHETLVPFASASPMLNPSFVPTVATSCVFALDSAPALAAPSERRTTASNGTKRMA